MHGTPVRGVTAAIGATIRHDQRLRIVGTKPID
jgi:hypothetical protein